MKFITTLTAKFKIMTLHNSSFAQLNFTANNLEHELLLPNPSWFIPVAASLLETGALAGYDTELIIRKFSRFTIFLNSSEGSVTETTTGVSFLRTNIGPYNIRQIIRNRSANTENNMKDTLFVDSNFDNYFNGFIRQVSEDYEAALKAHYHHYHQDDPEYLGFNAAESLAASALSIESCYFKFFPRSINENIAFPVTEVIQIQPKHVPLDANGEFIDIPIALKGDSRFLKLNPAYKVAPLANDPTGTTQFRYFSHNHLMTGMNDALLPQIATGDGEILDGVLERHINAYPNVLFQTTHSVAEDTIVPSSVIPSDPPKKYINTMLDNDTLNDIIFAHGLASNAEREVEQDNLFDYGVPETEEERAFREYQEQEEFRRVNSRLNDEEDIFGCIINKTNKIDESILRTKTLWVPPNIQDSNCFLRCLRHALLELKRPDILNEEEDYTKLREKYTIAHQTHLSKEDLQLIANTENYNLRLYKIVTTEYSKMTLRVQADREESRIIQRFELDEVIAPQNINYDTVSLHFLVHKQHCYYIQKLDQLIGKVKCNTCSQWITKSAFSTHIASCYFCNKCSRSYKKKSDEDQHECKDISQRRLTPSEHKAKILAKSKEYVCENWTHMDPPTGNKFMMKKSKMWVADFEAFPDPLDQQNFRPYSIGLLNLAELDQEKVHIFYGKDAMKSYLQYLTNFCTGNLYYYNGARFDNYLHLKGMVDYGLYIESDGFIKMGGRILTFKHKDKLQVFDLCLFLQTSLKKACKAWGVPEGKSKGEFDHEKIKSFADAELHRKEVTAYLKLDCIALGHLLRIYQSAMWECFHVDMARCITPATFALKAWGSTIDFHKKIYIPHRGKEEEDDRAAYLGGRVMCQYQEFQSSEWCGIRGSSFYEGFEYDEVEDYLVIADVNSLYPAVQHSNDYAYGRWKYHFFDKETDKNKAKMMTQILSINSQHESVEWTRSMFLVDVTCPKDIITSFLMERDASGEILHNLNDKVKKWYWGTELEEAIILGYRVTHLYEIKRFKKSGPIFKAYIDKCWNERKKHASGTAQNICYKFAMNGLTGKFGQKSHLTNTYIYSTNYKPNEERERLFDLMMERVVNFEPLFASLEDHKEEQLHIQNAILLEVMAESAAPSYPIYLSAQILANARVHMSRIMRTCNAYRDPSRAIYYTDTDSLVMPSACLAPLKEAGFIGKGLGQMKCDLNENFNDQTQLFAKIIRGVWAATKGPYSLAFLLPDNENVLMEKIRVKGIPHIDKPVKYYDPVQFTLEESDQVLMERVQRWLESPLTYQLPGSIIGRRFYLYQSEDKKTSYYAKNINQDMIRAMMKKEGHIYAYYGGMKKQFSNNAGQFLMIRPTAVMRTVCKTDWWSKGKRIYLNKEEGEEPSPTELSYPVGYSQ